MKCPHNYSLGRIRSSYIANCSSVIIEFSGTFWTILMPFCQWNQLRMRASIFIYDLILLILMPELPQVQTVRRFLQQALLKPKPKKIKFIHFYYPPIVKQIDTPEFSKILIGQNFSSVDRYGKFLILKLQSHSIISHLRMEGKYSFHATRPQIGKHDHVEFVMSDGSSLLYSDVRKFGTMHLVKKGEEMKAKNLSKLGPQVNGPDFTVEYLEQVCAKIDRSIKDVILDQEIVAGIGNIYADQILYAARIHPETIAKKVSPAALERITKQGKIIIERAILNKGTTFKSFSSNNQSGQFQNCLKVYGRAGQKCQQCNGTISKIKVAQRGTHFCAKCQLKGS